MPVLTTDMSSISQKRFKFIFSCSISARSFIKYVLAKCVCIVVLHVSSDPGFPIQVQPNGVNLAIGSPGLPLTSCIAQWRSAQSRPIRTSTTGLFAILGNLICRRCDQRLVYSVQSKAFIDPTTLVAVYAATPSFTSPVKLSSST